MAERSCSANGGSPPRRSSPERFPDVPLVGDVRDLKSLPKVDVVAAGFPCTDLSQAGRTRGIQGSQSGLVAEVFRLLRRQRVPLLVLENVRNMLVLDSGEAMRYLSQSSSCSGTAGRTGWWTRASPAYRSVANV